MVWCIQSVYVVGQFFVIFVVVGNHQTIYIGNAKRKLVRENIFDIKYFTIFLNSPSRK